jgi:serine/threonine protein kinase
MKYCTVCNAKYEDGVSFCAVDGEVLEDDPTTIVDQTLDGQYHVEAMLGKGGMGAVYRARHILLGDRVAIKVLPPQMRNNAEWLRRFRREGQAARRFRHPNAVTVYDLRTTSEGMIYMVMEYVEGRTLDAELKARGRFTPEDAMNVLEPVASVLNAAHAQGVVHRDLKPENIMIGKATTGGEPTIKLLDLGIAKISEVAGSNAGGSTALTVAGQILGTPFYMSPEQWGEVPHDGSSEIDGRADIYSLGAVCYELISGRKAFTGLTLQELRRQHVQEMPRPLHEFMTDVPEAFSRAIARAMAKDRGDRFATAGEFLNELRASLGLSPMSMSGSALNLQDSSAAARDSVSAAQVTGVESPDGRNTSSEVITPTIVTVDSPPRPDANAQAAPSVQPYAYSTNPQEQPAPTGPVNAPFGGTMPTVATSNPSAYQQPMAAPSMPYMPVPAQAAQKKGAPLIPIIAGALVLLLVVGGLGAWFVLSRMSAKPQPVSDNPTKDTSDVGKNTPPADGAAAMTEALRYALEAELTPGGKTARVVDVVPLASGQRFRFHFTPSENGYLYIVGPGDNNVPTTFLTAQPFPNSGVKTNAVEAGVDYSFPLSGKGDYWITLDENPGREEFTVIFSTTQLMSPLFFNREAGEPLTALQQQEFKEFKAKYMANEPKTDVTEGNDPFVSVKIPQARAADEPVVFNIRIEHK